MALELKWNGAALEGALHGATFRGIQAGGMYLYNKERIAISVPVVKIRKTRTRNTSRGAKGSTYMAVIERSKVGEPPRLDTGFGRDNTVYEDSQAELAARVGIRKNAMYMFKHEVTGRSHLRRTLNEEQRQIAAVIQVVSTSEAKRAGL